MKYSINYKKSDVPDGFEQIVKKKLSKFDRFFKDGSEASVSVTRKRGFATVELTISSSGVIFRSEQSDKNFISALDNCLAAIERQVRKNKTRLNKKLREGVFVKGFDSDVLYSGPDYEEEGEFNIRYKSFIFKPMSVEEAILQMNLTDHDFYVFENSESGKVNIVYKRKDGDYGCIEPQ